jgi:bacterioferritin-associated ferredoxin
MIICSCNLLSDHDVRRVVTVAAVQTLTAGNVYDCLGCGARCGRCARTIKRIMQEASLPGDGSCVLPSRPEDWAGRHKS